ncbi:MAG: superoxide dismutase [Candidatus Omnitrophica bacterium]|nr:superoxide dismutase [Candidatus Omnitrophota bacterium]
MRKILCVFVSLFVLLGCTGEAFSHCQIPCGIYDDEMRFKMIDEDLQTIEKSMNAILELSGEKEKDYNQIVRWVENKEHHADKISETVTYYFLAQRVRIGARLDINAHKDYTDKLRALHEMLYYAMMAKQTTDVSFVNKMRASLEKFKSLYFAE